jgi:hypothetical protein
MSVDSGTGSNLTPVHCLLELFNSQLPGEIKGDWGYRRMSAYAGFVFPEADERRRIPSKLGWLSNGVTITTRLARLTPPRLFTPPFSRRQSCRPPRSTEHSLGKRQPSARRPMIGNCKHFQGAGQVERGHVGEGHDLDAAGSRQFLWAFWHFSQELTR